MRAKASCFVFERQKLFANTEKSFPFAAFHNMGSSWALHQLLLYFFFCLTKVNFISPFVLARSYKLWRLQKTSKCNKMPEASQIKKHRSSFLSSSSVLSYDAPSLLPLIEKVFLACSSKQHICTLKATRESGIREKLHEDEVKLRGWNNKLELNAIKPFKLFSPANKTPQQLKRKNKHLRAS